MLLEPLFSELVTRSVGDSHYATSIVQSAGIAISTVVMYDQGPAFSRHHQCLKGIWIMVIMKSH